MNILGQLVMTGVSGVELTPEEEKFISEENIGGVVLFSRNYKSPVQLIELVNAIQSLRNEYPLYIAVDHEGGRVVRFKQHFTEIPPMYQLAKTGSSRISYRVAKIMAEELRSCGVNLNLAPVCDIWTNPDNEVIGDRSFGHDAETVSYYVSSIIRGFQTNGVLACAKHFPGHGCTTEDSHHRLPVVRKSLEELKSQEFFPFVKAIKSRVEFVMMAHMTVEGIDPNFPCSLSPRAHEILRRDLKFSKIIISDDMQMGAITDSYGVEEASLMALSAGSDIIEYRDMEFAQKALEGLKRAKSTRKINNDLIGQKIRRILLSKKENIAEYRPILPKSAKGVLAAPDVQTFMAGVRKKIAISG